MGKVKQINIKNRTCYFYNDQINLKDFEARLSTKKITKRFTFITCVLWLLNCNNINSVNPLYLKINEMIGQNENNEKWE